MASSMVESLNQCITPDIISQAGSFMGETEQTVRRGFSAAIPTVLASVANRSDDPGFMEQVYDLACDPDNDLGILDSLGTTPYSSTGVSVGSPGSRFASFLFGAQRGALERSLSGYAGLKPSSAASMLDMVAPMVLAYLGGIARQTERGATGLAARLRDQKISIQSSLPSGFSRVLPDHRERVAETLGPFGRMEAASASDPYRGDPTHRAPSNGRSAMKWVIPGVLVLAGLWAITSLFRDRGAPEAPATAAYLPGDTGIEDRLTSDIRAGGGTWHDLDGVTFVPGSADTTPGSSDELADLAAILKAHPETPIVLTAFSADAPDDEANLDLSRRRADHVKQVLVDLGVPGSQVIVEPFADRGAGMGDVVQVARGRENGVAVKVVKR